MASGFNNSPTRPYAAPSSYASSSPSRPSTQHGHQQQQQQQQQRPKLHMNTSAARPGSTQSSPVKTHGHAGRSPSRPRAQQQPGSPARGRPHSYHPGPPSPTKPHSFHNPHSASSSPVRQQHGGYFQNGPPSPTRGRQMGERGQSPQKYGAGQRGGRQSSPVKPYAQQQHRSSPTRPHSYAGPNAGTRPPLSRPPSSPTKYAGPPSPTKSYAGPPSPTKPYVQQTPPGSPTRHSYNVPGSPPQKLNYQAFQPPPKRPTSSRPTSSRNSEQAFTHQTSTNPRSSTTAFNQSRASLPTPTNSHAPLLNFATPPSTSASFDPKPITRAAENPPPPKPKPAAPYLHLDYHHNPEDAKHRNRYEARLPFGRRTMKAVRWSGFGIRIVQLLAALGVGVTHLFLRNIPETEAWMCRIPAAVALVHYVYSLYALSSTTQLLTPRSSKLYHLFALTLDITLTAFLSFNAVLSWRQHSLGITWTTMLKDPSITPTMILVNFITVVTTAGLGVVMMGITAWLIYAFRILSQLPPDLNPWVVEEAVVVKKRWSALSEEGWENRAAVTQPRHMPFQQTRQRPTTAHQEKNKGKYAAINVDEVDITDSTNAPTPPSTSGEEAGEARDELASLHRKSSFEVGDDEAMLKKEPQNQPEPGVQRKQSVVEKIRSLKIRKQKKEPEVVAADGPEAVKVKGFSKAALLGPGGNGGARFRKVSGEAQ